MCVYKLVKLCNWKMNNLSTETATKQDVAVALKNTAKGRLSYETAMNYNFDSLQVCCHDVFVLQYLL